jgi:hypothetical protein
MNAALNWTPRILALAHSLFLSVFALDAFEGDDSLGRKLVGFIIHLAPTLAELAALGIAWRRRVLGGGIFVALSGFSFLITGTENTLPVYAMIAVPPAIAGLLFIASGLRSTRSPRA